MRNRKGKNFIHGKIKHDQQKNGSDDQPEMQSALSPLKNRIGRMRNHQFPGEKS
jgi:hypothetical protein